MRWFSRNGILVPKTATFYNWDGDQLVGEPLARLLYSNVRFSKNAPDKATFAKPPDALIAPL